MSVHQEISAHSAKQHERIQQFAFLDSQREKAIDEAIAQCKAGNPINVDAINVWTEKINELAKQGIVPQRLVVTEKMVRDYVEKK
ncbi:DUF2533 family protein [Mangrovibacillus cuniculi]|uniref:DUF2533 family protein n=1 Tax=Mangrovibacillus cuniculi TaxID=2593652 RepID=A0A7S8HFE2_9BACI|nr:DUF2533 family protein [Mangrovibacillus cuniculi]QPC46431.1 DUF2533 family protein [Mangrovibacillus cuniculi]